MSLTLVNNPVSGISEIFAGFDSIPITFKREDIQITGVESGIGGSKITHTGDLSSYINVGDTIYLYSEGTNYTYDRTGTVLTVVAGEVTVDIPYIETATDGYMNYFRNYYVELQLVNKDNSDIDVLGFSLESDGDPSGNIIIDVNIANDLNTQRGIIATEFLEDCNFEFEVKYRQVYEGSSESFTLVDNKLFIVVFTLKAPETETILNNFNLPNIYLSYPASIGVAHKDGISGETIELTYNELDINRQNIASGTLGELDSELNGLFLWEWESSATVDVSTKYINFDFAFSVAGEYSATDYDSDEYST